MFATRLAQAQAHPEHADPKDGLAGPALFSRFRVGALHRNEKIEDNDGDKDPADAKNNNSAGPGLFSRFKMNSASNVQEDSKEEGGDGDNENAEQQQLGFIGRFRAAREEQARLRAEEEARREAEEKARIRKEEAERKKAMQESMETLGLYDDDDSFDDGISIEYNDIPRDRASGVDGGDAKSSDFSVPSEISLSQSEVGDLKALNMTKWEIRDMKKLHSHLEMQGIPTVLTIENTGIFSRQRRRPSLVSLGDESYVADIMNQQDDHEDNLREEALETSFLLYMRIVKEKKMKPDEKMFEKLYEHVLDETREANEEDYQERWKILAANADLVEKIKTKQAKRKAEASGEESSDERKNDDDSDQEGGNIGNMVANLFGRWKHE